MLEAQLKGILQNGNVNKVQESNKDAKANGNSLHAQSAQR